jgi:hypothetical protein
MFAGGRAVWLVPGLPVSGSWVQAAAFTSSHSSL